MNDLLFEVPDSHIPPLARLRAEYNAAQAAYDEASEHEDESGEAVPREIISRLNRTRRLLLEEEVRITNGWPSRNS